MKFKKVVYFGRVLEIPEGHYVVATDENGFVFSYGADIYKSELLGIWIFSDERNVRSGDAMLMSNCLNASRNIWKELKVTYPEDYNALIDEDCLKYKVFYPSLINLKGQNKNEHQKSMVLRKRTKHTRIAFYSRNELERARLFI